MIWSGWSGCLKFSGFYFLCAVLCSRFSELSGWLLSQQTTRSDAETSSLQVSSPQIYTITAYLHTVCECRPLSAVWLQLTSLFLPLQMEHQAVTALGETLDWLKARLAVLEDISPESEVHTQRAALDKLSQQFSALLQSLSEVKGGLHVFMFAPLP